MEQLDLLTIRKQPAPRAPEIPSRVIKAYVRENLRDFPRRQAERERVRKLFQGKYNKNRKAPRPKREDAHHHMRIIRVTFRAVFEYPKGELNPMGLKLPGPQPVEVFGSGERWEVREIASPRHQVYEKLGRFSSADHAKDAVTNVFDKMLEPWQMWGTMPGDGDKALAVKRILTPYDVVSLGGGKWAALDPEDRTHIIHAQTIPPGAKIPPAACGRGVNTKCFISTKANVAPSCKECAEVWRKEYQNK